MRPIRARTPVEAAHVATRRSCSSFAWPYGEAGRGGVTSVKGGPSAPAYTPPADDARKNEPSSGRSSTRARAVRKSASSPLSTSSAGCSVAVTPEPAHHAMLHGPSAALAANPSRASVSWWRARAGAFQVSGFGVRHTGQSAATARSTFAPSSPRPTTHEITAAALSSSHGRGAVGRPWDRRRSGTAACPSPCARRPLRTRRSLPVRTRSHRR